MAHSLATNPFVSNLIPGKGTETNLLYRASTRELIQGPRGLPLMKPPYGRITAIDLNRGEQAWMVPNGDGPRNHPLLKDLHLPPLGQAVRAAPLVTKTLLFVSEGDQINVRTPPTGGGRKFRAFDKATGRVICETELEAGTTGTPITYLYKGRQFIVVAIGGLEHPAELGVGRVALRIELLAHLAKRLHLPLLEIGLGEDLAVHFHEDLLDDLTGGGRGERETPPRRRALSSRISCNYNGCWRCTMPEKVSTIDVRQRIGDMLNRVSLRHDEFIIERKGKALAALVPVERLEQMRRFARTQAIAFLDQQKGSDLTDKQSADLALEAQKWARRRVRKPRRQAK